MIIFTEVMAEMVKTVSADKEVRLELSEDKLQITISPQTEKPVNKKVIAKSTQESAKMYKVAPSSLAQGLKLHDAPEAPSTKKSGRKPRLHTWNGRTMTTEEWAKEYNCTNVAMRIRFSRNGSPEPLIKTKADKRKVK